MRSILPRRRRLARAANADHGDLAADAPPQANVETAKTERRERAQRFLKDALAHGPKQVSDIEEAATRAHVDPHALEQARADLGLVVSRSNAGGVQAVQWSLPG